MNNRLATCIAVVPTGLRTHPINACTTSNTAALCTKPVCTPTAAYAVLARFNNGFTTFGAFRHNDDAFFPVAVAVEVSFETRSQGRAEKREESVEEAVYPAVGGGGAVWRPERCRRSLRRM